jgi:hypothetical protein
MSNKGRLILFSVFALLTFYQFYTYAKLFRLDDFLPLDPHVVLYGVFVTKSSTNLLNQIDFAIPLLALNIFLWIETPTQVGRRPLILAFITNLLIMILRVGFGNPAIKQYLTDLKSNPATLTSPFAQWNALYLAGAIVSTLIVIGLLIRLLRHNHFILPLLFRASEQFRGWRQTSAVSKIKPVLFLIFTLLTFYQFVAHAKPVHHDPSQAKEAINEILLSHNGRADVGIVIASDYKPVSPIPSLVLALNIILWVINPKRIGRLLLTLSFLANLAIVLIPRISDAMFERAGGYQGMSIDARYLQLDQWDNVYRILATISTLIVAGMLFQVWRKQQFRPYSLR